MEFKFLIVLLCIELSVAHHYFNHHTHSHSYSDEDYSEEEPEISKNTKTIYPKERIPEDKRLETPKFPALNYPQGKNTVKTIPQYEVTENVIDVPNDNTVDGRVDTRYMVNKGLNYATSAKVNKVTVMNENKQTNDEKFEELEKEYLDIVKMLSGNERNQLTNAKMINFIDIFTKIKEFWIKVKNFFRFMQGNDSESNEIDEAQSFLNKIHKTGKDVVTEFRDLFGGR